MCLFQTNIVYLFILSFCLYIQIKFYLSGQTILQFILSICLFIFTKLFYILLLPSGNSKRLFLTNYFPVAVTRFILIFVQTCFFVSFHRSPFSIFIQQFKACTSLQFFLRSNYFSLDNVPKLCVFIISIFWAKKYTFKARSHDLVVKEKDLKPRGCGFESWCLILDEMKAKQEINVAKCGAIKHYLKNVLFTFFIEKNTIFLSSHSIYHL